MRARTVPEQLFTGLAKVRMLIKRGLASPVALVEGRALADSLVRQFQGHREADARMVASVAALTGRIAVASSELRRETGSAEGGRTFLSTEGEVLLLYAASRTSNDSVAVLSQRVDQLIQQKSPESRSAWRMGYIGRAATLSFQDTVAPQARELLGQGDYLLDAQLRILAGDSLRAARQLIAVVSARTAPPGDVPLDAVCAEAATVSAAGDRTTALRWTRAALESFPVAPPDVFSDVTAAAVLGPCLRFAEGLEDAFGNDMKAAQWRRAADVLLGSPRANGPSIVR